MFDNILSAKYKWPKAIGAIEKDLLKNILQVDPNL
jgi:hypothetical protein